jgi:hypothetical protein
MDRIRADLSHDDVFVMFAGVIKQRRFGDWSMSLVRAGPGADAALAELIALQVDDESNRDGSRTLGLIERIASLSRERFGSDGGQD